MKEEEKGFVALISFILAVCWAIYGFAMYLCTRHVLYDDVVMVAIVFFILFGVGALLLYVTAGFVDAIVSD